MQESIELVRLRLEQVGFSGKPAVWNAALKEVNTAKSLIDSPDLIKGINGKDKKNAMELVDQAKVKQIKNISILEFCFTKKDRFLFHNYCY